ncbi:hypothetical protein FHG87_024261 [Trinorchestia longiramus]|nr:hypothetical protein FHG87_024261 [Trinorchestia longiramus]
MVIFWYEEILQHHVTAGNQQAVLAVCDTHTDNSSLWLSALRLLTAPQLDKPPDTRVLQQVLSRVGESCSRCCLEWVSPAADELQLLPPMEVIELLSASGNVTLGQVRQYLTGLADREEAVAQQQRKLVSDLVASTNALRDQIHAIQSRYIRTLDLLTAAAQVVSHGSALTRGAPDDTLELLIELATDYTPDNTPLVGEASLDGYLESRPPESCPPEVFEGVVCGDSLLAIRYIEGVTKRLLQLGLGRPAPRLYQMLLAEYLHQRTAATEGGGPAGGVQCCWLWCYVVLATVPPRCGTYHCTPQMWYLPLYPTDVVREAWEHKIRQLISEDNQHTVDPAISCLLCDRHDFPVGKLLIWEHHRIVLQCNTCVAVAWCSRRADVTRARRSLNSPASTSSASIPSTSSECSFHQHCFASYCSSSEEECPVCLPRHNDIRDSLRHQASDRASITNFGHNKQDKDAPTLNCGSNNTGVCDDVFEELADYLARGLFTDYTANLAVHTSATHTNSARVPEVRRLSVLIPLPLYLCRQTNSARGKIFVHPYTSATHTNSARGTMFVCPYTSPLTQTVPERRPNVRRPKKNLRPGAPALNQVLGHKLGNVLGHWLGHKLGYWLRHKLGNVLGHTGWDTSWEMC